MLDSSTIFEMEARSPRAPELDAEAPGPHILEMETVDAILETDSQRLMSRRDGATRRWTLVSKGVPVNPATNDRQSHTRFY